MNKIWKFPLINAHTHAAMIAFRGKAEDILLDKWLNTPFCGEERHLRRIRQIQNMETRR